MFIPALIAILLLGKLGETARLTCMDDADCMPNYFCYSTKVCSPCINCSVYFRSGRSGGCAKEAQQCGACLTGYSPESFVDGTSRGLCVPSSYAPTTSAASVPPWLIYTIISIGVIFSLVGFLMSHMRVCLTIKTRTRTIPKEPNSCGTDVPTDHAPSAPPPYSVQEEIQALVTYRKEEILQQANPYQCPDYVKAPMEHFGYEEGGYDEVDAPPTTPALNADPDIPVASGANANGPDLLDESTLPSAWTPGLGYGSEQEAQPTTLVTSFLGVLSLNNTQPANHSANTAHSAHSSGGPSRTDRGPPPQLNIYNNITVINADNAITDVMNINT